MSEQANINQNEKAAKIRRKPERESVLAPTFAAARQTSSNSRRQAQPSGGGLLQRQCSCGKHTIAGGICEECQQKQAGVSPDDFSQVASSDIQTTRDSISNFNFSHIPAQTRSSAERESIQPNLTANAPGDQYEQETDHVTDTVIRMPAPSSTSPSTTRRTGQTKPADRSIWASSRKRSGSNIFAKRAGPTGPHGAQKSPDVQRYVTSAGWFGNKVTFKSSGLGAVLAGGLSITKDATDLTIGSQAYDAQGTVKATGPKGRVKRFEVGFLQTVYDSRRTYYYQPDPYKPGLLRQIGTAVAPGLFSSRYKITDTLTQLPVRDGDAGVLPWYEISDVESFDHAKVSTKTTKMYDQPDTYFPWKQTVGGKTQYLVKTGGQDVFRSWLSVQKKGTTGFWGMHRLGYIDWKVDYGTKVTVNKANPAASVVTPTATSGGKIIGTHEGPGIKLPYMGDPVANDVTTEVKGKW